MESTSHWISVWGFWVVAVLGPVLVILVMTWVRHSIGASHTAASELWGLFVIFHLTMVVQSREFAKITGVAPAEAFDIIGGLGLMISAIMLMVSLLKLERLLLLSHRARTAATRRAPLPLWLFSWSGILAGFVLYTAWFTGRLPWLQATS